MESPQTSPAQISSEQASLKIGVVCSSGGSVFEQVMYICRRQRPDIQFFVVTDRPCGMEDVCKRHNVSWRRIEQADNKLFSQGAKEFFDSCADQHGNICAVLLFFSRLVTADLFRSYPTFNLHPSLLPAYRGFHAIERAQVDGARFLGATLHLVDENVDGGIIIAQTMMPLRRDSSVELLQKFSFVQKLYLTLLCVELLDTKALTLKEDTLFITDDLPFSDRCNPMLRDENLKKSVLALQELEGVEVIR